MQYHPPITLFLLLFTSHTYATSACWYPDGITVEPRHVPCNQTTNSPSACCASQDACSNGLCLSIYGAYRGSCTDQTWNSPNCAAKEWPQCLTDPSTRRRYSRAAAILSCSAPGTEGQGVCCSYSNGSSCCNDQFRLGIAGTAYSPGFDALATGLSSSAGTNTTNITTVRTGGQDIGTKVGLGIGVPLSLLVVGLISLLFYREYNKNKLIGDQANATVGLVNTRNRPSSMDQHNLYQDYSNTQSYPVSSAPQHTSYSPCEGTKVEPVFEAPASNVHEMRG